MCGILGLISNDHSPLIKMTEHQKMRGPDGTGSFFSENVAIAHNRLAIIDLSEGGKQPMESDRWVLSYNGEIYNHMELRRRLGPMTWKSHSDTLTLLMCIEHKGIDWTLNNIEGMFAFAAYDKFEKVVYLATDPMGIKPLYYYYDNKTFAFASSPGALTYLKDKWSFSRESLIDFLALGATYHPFFSGIRKLFGGQLRKFDTKTGALNLSRWYWMQDYTGITESDVLDAVKESINSVKIADVPLFMFLSGGVDSSVVASQCFGMNAVHLASPEEEFARQAASKYSNPFHIVHPRDYDAKICLEDYARQSGDCAMGAVIPYIVSKEIAKMGKVAISANGADELFGGYDRITGQICEKQWGHIFRQYFTQDEDQSSWMTWRQYYGSDRQLELSTYVQFDLNKTLDFASMCHGLEVRVPFLNRKVVEMALSLPFEKHVKQGRRKAILKEFLEKEGFSRQFIDRPKVGFSLHYQPQNHEKLKKEGVLLLKNEFGIDPKFTGIYAGRDQRYYEASAASFLCWWNVWKEKLI